MSGVARFEWDDANRGKCRSHGVSLSEIEEVLEPTDSTGPETFPVRAAVHRDRTQCGGTLAVRCLYPPTIRASDFDPPDQRSVYAQKADCAL